MQPYISDSKSNLTETNLSFIFVKFHFENKGRNSRTLLQSNRRPREERNREITRTIATKTPPRCFRKKYGQVLERSKIMEIISVRLANFARRILCCQRFLGNACQQKNYQCPSLRGDAENAELAFAWHLLLGSISSHILSFSSSADWELYLLNFENIVQNF